MAFWVVLGCFRLLFENKKKASDIFIVICRRLFSIVFLSKSEKNRKFPKILSLFFPVPQDVFRPYHPCGIRH